MTTNRSEDPFGFEQQQFDGLLLEGNEEEQFFETRDDMDMDMQSSDEDDEFNNRAQETLDNQEFEGIQQNNEFDQNAMYNDLPQAQYSEDVLNMNLLQSKRSQNTLTGTDDPFRNTRRSQQQQAKKITSEDTYRDQFQDFDDETQRQEKAFLEVYGKEQKEQVEQQQQQEKENQRLQQSSTQRDQQQSDGKEEILSPKDLTSDHAFEKTIQSQKSLMEDNKIPKLQMLELQPEQQQLQQQQNGDEFIDPSMVKQDYQEDLLLATNMDDVYQPEQPQQHYEQFHQESSDQQDNLLIEPSMASQQYQESQKENELVVGIPIQNYHQEQYEQQQEEDEEDEHMLIDPNMASQKFQEVQYDEENLLIDPSMASQLSPARKKPEHEQIDFDSEKEHYDSQQEFETELIDPLTLLVEDSKFKNTQTLELSDSDDNPQMLPQQSWMVTQKEISLPLPMDGLEQILEIQQETSSKSRPGSHKGDTSDKLT